MLPFFSSRRLIFYHSGHSKKNRPLRRPKAIKPAYLALATPAPVSRYCQITLTDRSLWNWVMVFKWITYRPLWRVGLLAIYWIPFPLRELTIEYYTIRWIPTHFLGTDRSLVIAIIWFYHHASERGHARFDLWLFTDAVDPRIQEMQDTIITKDAKLNAMQNSMAVSSFICRVTGSVKQSALSCKSTDNLKLQLQFLQVI